MDDRLVIEMNALATSSKDYAKAASLYFARKGRGEVRVEAAPSLASTILRLTGQHLTLVGVSLAIALLIGIPLGIVASRPGPLSSVILGFVGVVQTIPSLALLALLVPVAFPRDLLAHGDRGSVALFPAPHRPQHGGGARGHPRQSARVGGGARDGTRCPAPEGFPTDGAPGRSSRGSRRAR